MTEFACLLLPAKDKPGWNAVCLNFNLWAFGDTQDAAFDSLDDAVHGYIDTVLDTPDLFSIPRLLDRKASFRYWMHYLWHGLKQDGQSMHMLYEPRGQALYASRAVDD